MEIRQAMHFFPTAVFVAALCVSALSTPFAASPRARQQEISRSPRAVVENTSHDSGSAEQGRKLVHQFSIRNAGTSPLTVTRVVLSAPGMTARVKPAIPPGTSETLTVEWDTAGVKG